MAKKLFQIVLATYALSASTLEAEANQTCQQLGQVCLYDRDCCGGNDCSVDQGQQFGTCVASMKGQRSSRKH